MAPQLKASERFNIFYSSFDKPGTTEKVEANYYSVAFPIEHTPSMDELVSALSNKYPDACLAWSDALNRTALNHNMQAYSYKFYVPIQWTFLYEDKSQCPTFKWQDDIRRWVKTQPDLYHAITEMNFTSEDFWWTVKPTDHRVSLLHSQAALNLKGSTRIYCVLVPILEIS